VPRSWSPRSARYGTATLMVLAAVAVAPSALAVAAQATATVTVDASRTGAALPATVIGLSYEADRLATVPGFDPRHGNIANLLSTLGTGNIRIGAGAVDYFVNWNPGNKPQPSWVRTSIGHDDIDRLAALVKATGWNVELGVNLGHFDAKLVADEATYAVPRLGGHLVAMSCGNEPNLYGGRVRPSGYGYAQYRPEFEKCAAALASGGAKVAGPNTNGGRWLSDFVADEHSRVVMLTDQQYTLGGGPKSTKTVTDLLSAASVKRELSGINGPLAAARSGNLPLRRDETNSANIGGIHGVSDVYGAALWAVDYTLLLAQHGVSGLNFHGTIGQCGKPEQDNRVRFYTPLCAATATDLAAGMLTPQPVYYGLLLVHLLGPGRFLTDTVSSTGNITSYAVRGTDGKIRVVVVDKDPVSKAPVTVSLHLGTGTGAQLLHLTGTSLTSASGIAIQGATVSRTGTFTPGSADKLSGHNGDFTVTIHPGSAALLTVTG
jgi:hypothetical protein